MQDESYDDHEREENVECNGNRKVRKIEAVSKGAPIAGVRLRDLVVGEHDTHSCMDELSPERRDHLAENWSTYPKKRDT